MNLGTMADLTADITPEKRERIDAIKAEMIDAERGHELAALRKATMRWVRSRALTGGAIFTGIRSRWHSRTDANTPLRSYPAPSTVAA
ncbi:hypothetical protein [Streptomyces sp. GQFP]|uniref:hypothetical protein n=1 Tax=Streptomyces sp. GQFP TaxID=2907545 RepID=UPI001F48AB91|nr:hypothetical protein [Streptomyces sp. GQFP]UIX31772.1 hypothetical protein LUX31_17980 [Streptomyces sp. GQFP]